MDNRQLASNAAKINAFAAPYGMGRIESAAYVGVSPTFFDRLVLQGLVPRPRVVGSRKIWVRPELEISVDAFPLDRENEANPWDEIPA